MKFKYYYQRDMTRSSGDTTNKQTNKQKKGKMNDDSVSESEIGPTKETCGLVTNS